MVTLSEICAIVRCSIQHMQATLNAVEEITVQVFFKSNVRNLICWILACFNYLSCQQSLSTNHAKPTVKRREN